MEFAIEEVKRMKKLQQQQEQAKKRVQPAQQPFQQSQKKLNSPFFPPSITQNNFQHQSHPQQKVISQTQRAFPPKAFQHLNNNNNNNNQYFKQPNQIQTPNYKQHQQKGGVFQKAFPIAQETQRTSTETTSFYPNRSDNRSFSPQNQNYAFKKDFTKDQRYTTKKPLNQYQKVPFKSEYQNPKKYNQSRKKPESHQKPSQSSFDKKSQIASRFQQSKPNLRKRKEEQEQFINDQQIDQQAQNQDQEEQEEQDQSQQENYQQQNQQEYNQEENQQEQEEQQQDESQYQQEQVPKQQYFQRPQKRNLLSAYHQKQQLSPVRNIPDYEKPVVRTQYKSLKRKQRNNLKDKIYDRHLAETMCPEQQFQDRETIFRNYNKQQGKLTLDLEQWFSFFEIDKKTKKPSLNLAIKKYRRSTGAQTFIRSPETLKKTIQHILKNIVDSDHKPLSSLPFIGPVQSESIQYSDIYNFLWNRLRAVIIDITEMPEQLNFSQECIFCLEMIARFYFLSINERRSQKDFADIDEKINRDRISQTLSGLIEAYKHSRSKLKRLISNLQSEGLQITDQLLKQHMKKQKIYISPHQPEIFSYAFVYEKDFSRLQTFYEDFREFDYNPLLESQEIKLSIQILEVINSKNYNRFFQILESDRVTYLNASCMLHWIQSIRCDILQSIHNNWKSSETSNGMAAISLKKLDQYLHFQGNRKELVEFIIHVGGTLDNSQNNMLHKGFGKLIEGYIPPYYKFESNKLRRNIYGLPLNNNNQFITREEILRGTWKKSNYDIIIKNLFRSQKSKILQFIKPSSPKEDLNSHKYEDKKIATIDTKPPEDDQRKDLLEKIKKKKRVKYLKQVEDLTLDIFTKRIKQQMQVNRKITAMGLAICSWQFSLVRQGFKSIKSILDQKIQKKRAFKLIKQARARRTLQQLRIYLSKQWDQQIFHPQFHNYNQVQCGFNKNFQSKQADNLLTANNFGLQGRFDQNCVLAVTNSQMQILDLQDQIIIRIVFLININYLRSNFRINYIRDILQYIQSSGKLDQFDQFINVGGQCHWQKDIPFTYKDVQKTIILSFDCLIFNLEQQGETPKQIIQKECFGADIVVIPIINQQQKLPIFKQIRNQICSSDIKFDQLYFLIPVASNPTSTPIPEQLQNTPSYINFYQTSNNNPSVTLVTSKYYLKAIYNSIQSKPNLPPLLYASLSYQLGTIFKNMQYVKNMITDFKLQYFYYETHVMDCIDQLIQVTKIIFSCKQRIYGWKDTLYNLLEQNRQEITFQISLQQISNLQQKRILGLLQNLKIQLVANNYYFQPNKKQLILNKCVDYLSQFHFDNNERQEYYQRVQYYIQKQITLNRNQLPDGDIKTLFDNLLYVVIMYFQQNDIYILLPQNFKYSINKEFLQKVDRKYKNLVSKLEPNNPAIKSKKLRKLLELPEQVEEESKGKRKFQYIHENWFNISRKKRKIQSFEQKIRV